MERLKKTLFPLLFICFFYSTVYSQINKVPASKNPIVYKQSDGSILYITLKGDERLHWAETSDGYTLLPNKKGDYEYAKLDRHKNLNTSGKLAHEAGKRTKRENVFLKKIRKGLQFSDEQIKKHKNNLK